MDIGISKRSIKKFLKKHKWLLIILLAAVLLRLAFGAIVFNNFGDKGFYPAVNEDAGQYWQLSKNIVRHGVFSISESAPFENETVRVPGYPFFVSLFYRIYPAVWPVMIVQNLIALFNIVLIYAISMLLFRKKAVALIAGLIYAVEPAVIYWNNQLLSETLFTFITLASIYIFIRYVFIEKQHLIPTALAVGALIALANYTRSIAQFILFIFILFSFAIVKLNLRSISRNIIFVLLMVISFSALSAPWMVRGKILTGDYEFSSASTPVGFGRYLYLMYRNSGKSDEEFFQIKKSDMKAETVKYIAQNPLVFAKIHLLAFAPFLMGDSYFTVAGVMYPPLEEKRIITEWLGSWQELKSFLLGHKGAEAFLFFGGKAILLVLNLFALVGILFWLFVFKKNRASALLFLLLIYYFILATGPSGYSRMRHPVNPYIYIFAAVGIYLLIKHIKSKKITANSNSI